MSDIEQLVGRLQEILGERGVLTGDDVTGRPNHSWGQGSCPARTILRPASTEELAQVMRLGCVKAAFSKYQACHGQLLGASRGLGG